MGTPRQDKANERARRWGFKNDYQMRKHRKKYGIHTQGHAALPELLASLESPKNFKAARDSGALIDALQAMDLTYYDKSSKSRKPITKERLNKYIKDMQRRDKEKAQYWNLNSLRTLDDWTRLLLLAQSDFQEDSKGIRARLDALYYIMVEMNGYNAREFWNAYRDVIIEANVDFEEYVKDHSGEELKLYRPEEDYGYYELPESMRGPQPVKPPSIRPQKA